MKLMLRENFKKTTDTLSRPAILNCMYACMYVCVDVCTYVCMYVRMYVCMNVGR